ncbi:hypothetical protein, partial [Wolbachia endosymbiont of Operophtera brumata]|uniref:hypothetical protein n=1 Tax=Wolbachia endosymbiont of Operophtera brumata TaxID=1620420 RepID=UPI001F38F512
SWSYFSFCKQSLTLIETIFLVARLRHTTAAADLVAAAVTSFLSFSLFFSQFQRVGLEQQ